MTDKEKIRKEVERLMTELIQEKKKSYSSDVDDACILELQNVLTYIDSLPEEKRHIREYVSSEDSALGKLLKEMKDFSPEEDLGISNEEYNDFVNELIFGKEKSVSNDLEEAAKLYAEKLLAANMLNTYKEYSLQTQKTMPIFEAYDVEQAFEDGALWQKEQMMGAAIKGIARPLDDEVWCDGDEFPKNIQDGDKVKVLIIKEE